jgi:hypothetical protein
MHEREITNHLKKERQAPTCGVQMIFKSKELAFCAHSLQCLSHAPHKTKHMHFLPRKIRQRHNHIFLGKSDSHSLSLSNHIHHGLTLPVARWPLCFTLRQDFSVDEERRREEWVTSLLSFPSLLLPFDQ